MTLEASSAPRWVLGFEACRVPTLTLHLTVKHTTLDCGDLLYDGCLSYLDWRCCEGSDYVPFKIVISTWHSNWANEYLLNKFSSVHFSHSVVSNSLWSHGLQHTWHHCPSPTPRACSNSCPESRWHHPTISSSVVPFSSCLQPFPASGSFPISQFFASGVQSIGVSASASLLPMNIQDWFPLGFTGWISLQSKGLSRVFSNNTDQKHQLFSAQLSL